MNKSELVHAVLGEVDDKTLALQLGFMLGRQRVNIESDDITELMPKINNANDSEDEKDEYVKNL